MRAVVAFLLLQHLREARRAFVAFLSLADVVNRGHGADENFARGERADDADADFPIEAKWFDEWFDGAAEVAGEAVTQMFA